MALKRFTVPNDNEVHSFGSMAWRAQLVGNDLVFTNDNMKRPSKITLRNVVPGEEVGFTAAGEMSRAFKVKAPKDQKYRILWNHGFTKPKRVSWDLADGRFPGLHFLLIERVGSAYDNQYGQCTLDWNVKYTTIQNDKGEIMVQTACGRLEYSNNFMEEWYLDSRATLDHVKAWEEKNRKGGDFCEE